MRAILVVVILFSFCPVLCAQVIFEPAQVQHRTTVRGRDRVYFYGGQDPAVHLRAQRDAFFQDSTERANPVYNEHIRRVDARVYGFGVNDAVNQAAMEMPTYFKMSELRSTAIPQRDGSWIIRSTPPAETNPAAPCIDDRQHNKGMILIIPRKQHGESPAEPSRMSDNQLSMRD